MSTTIGAVVINLLATLLPLVGVQVGTDALTTSVQTILLVATGIWIWWKRVKVGDVSAIGVRK